MVELIGAAVLGFVCGSIPFAVIISKLFKLPDPRKFGSNNPGATNVMRSGNKLAGRLVFALDFAKSLVPALVALMLTDNLDIVSVIAGMAVVGHVWSPWLNWHGGRGVATGFGALLAINWMCGLLAAAVWFTFYFAVKVVSIASVFAFVAATVAAFFIPEIVGVAKAAIPGVAMIIVIRHRDNLKKLSQGTEHSFQEEKDDNKTN